MLKFVNQAIFHSMEGSNHCNTARPHLAHLSPAEYSTEVFGKIFRCTAACDDTESVASQLAEYSDAVLTGFCSMIIFYQVKL